MKSQSTIPFAKEAAELMWGSSVPASLSEAITEENARRRLRHFESRYRSLDRLLLEAAFPNVLEIGAGLSFRGLELTQTRSLFYIDTDLPAIAALKAELIAQLSYEPPAGTLRVQALDALDREALGEAVASMPPGPLAIANEGLLVYLDEGEKARLADNVRRVLLARGGVWLTADVYVRNPGGSAPNVSYGRSREFLDRHRVEQNKFQDWKAAERFFSSNGFRVSKKLAHEHPAHIRESWALVAC